MLQELHICKLDRLQSNSLILKRKLNGGQKAERIRGAIFSDLDPTS